MWAGGCVRRVWLLFLVLLTPVLWLGTTPPSITRASSGGDSYAGWAMDAYPDLSAADFTATFVRMRDAGANLVWIGHNNPAAVDPAALEVGLSYPVYAAAINSGDPHNGAALSIIAAQRRALDAARAVGIKVVLPINYRTQMGDAWNAAHQDSVRRGPDGTILNFGGEDASPYAGVFRSDNRRYYEWIDQTFVGPYRDVILMLNLGDEPTGVDYSLPADSTFFAATGYHFADVGTDPQRIQQLGAFQSHVMVDFATWAAWQWVAIDPAVMVTISFDGGPGRDNQQAPAIEDIFRQAPPNFQPGWSAYPRDGKPFEAVDDSNLTGLSTLLGTLAHFSARYQRPYWLWSSGNSWGLGQESADPSSVADAMVNFRMLADVSKQAGGLLRGIAVWNYNVRHQGLYNNTGPTSYNPDDLFARVSAQFAGVRQVLLGRSGPGPNVLILAPNAMPQRLIASTQLVNIWSLRGYNFGDLVSLVRSGATPAVVGTLAGEDLSGIRLLVVLARDQADLTPADVAAIRAYRGGGHVLVDAQSVDGSYNFGAQWVAPSNAAEYFFSDAYTVDHIGPVSAFGLPRLGNSFAIVGPTELIAYGGTSHDPPATMTAWLSLPNASAVTQYNVAGNVSGGFQAGPGLVAIPTQRHTFSIVAVGAPPPAPAPTDRYFAQTGFQVDNDAIWDYFNRRGGVATFGYPVSRVFVFQGFKTQMFQRRIVQLDENGHPRLLNLLDSGLMPYSSFNGALLPGVDSGLVASAPSPTDATRVLAFIQAHALNVFRGSPVNFLQTFNTTVSLGAAFPNGGDVSLLPGFNLELWGIPTSQPTPDPNNHNFVYQRFQRGAMHFDASCHCTQGILLADYFKSILTGQNLPADLDREARSSPYYRQYDPGQPNWVHHPDALPNTDLTNAFTPR